MLIHGSLELIIYLGMFSKGLYAIKYNNNKIKQGKKSNLFMFHPHLLCQSSIIYNSYTSDKSLTSVSFTLLLTLRKEPQ